MTGEELATTILLRAQGGLHNQPGRANITLTFEIGRPREGPGARGLGELKRQVQ